MARDVWSQREKEDLVVATLVLAVLLGDDEDEEAEEE